MAIISKVEKIKSKYMIQLDSGIKYWLSQSSYEERPFSADAEVDEEEFKHWILLQQFRPALEKAVAMLAMRACSKAEIKIRLKRNGYAVETIEMVIYKLEKEQLLDDADFARQWVSSRSAKYGSKRIAQELRMKGISSEEIQDILEEIPEEKQLEQAVSLAKKYILRIKDDSAKGIQKTLAMLVRRGYPWDIASHACSKAVRELKSEMESF